MSDKKSTTEGGFGRRIWLDWLLALTFLTRVPVPSFKHSDRLAQVVWAFPIVGVLVGAVGAVLYFAATGLGLPSFLAAVIAIAGQILLTGGLHEDGLADVADGFGGGTTIEQKLRIMSDSRIGTYGVAALVLLLLSRIGATSMLGQAGGAVALPVAGALSRSAMVGVFVLLPSAKSEGLGASAGRPSRRPALAALVLTAVIAGFFLSHDLWAAIVAILAAGLATLIMTWLAWRQIRGHTGDVLGAVQQLTEIAVLFAIVMGIT